MIKTGIQNNLTQRTFFSQSLESQYPISYISKGQISRDSLLNKLASFENVTSTFSKGQKLEENWLTLKLRPKREDAIPLKFCPFANKISITAKFIIIILISYLHDTIKHLNKLLSLCSIPIPIPSTTSDNPFYHHLQSTNISKNTFVSENSFT